MPYFKTHKWEYDREADLWTCKWCSATTRDNTTYDRDCEHRVLTHLNIGMAIEKKDADVELMMVKLRLTMKLFSEQNDVDVHVSDWEYV